MAVKIAPISRAVPAAERKRTREKVPATATPAPRLPLTIMMMTLTMAGRVASVTAKLLVGRAYIRYTTVRIKPSTRAETMQIRKPDTVMVPAASLARIASSTVYISF